MEDKTVEEVLNDEAWAQVRDALKAAEDDGETWWDKNEIRESIIRANAMDIEPSIVLACYEACSSHAGLVQQLHSIAGRKRRVLAIDDEEAILDGLRANLEATRRYEVCTVLDPTKAVEAALEFNPDIILIDIMMPEKHGFDLLQELRSNESLRSTPAIMVTALADQLDAGGVAKDGVLYLSKPVSMKKLVYCIEEHVHVGSNERR